jgi:septation ring formation regulator EzrA
MGYLCKRVLAFDSGSLRQCGKRGRSPDAKQPCPSNAKDAFHWRRVAASKSGEVAQLQGALTTREKEYASLFEMNSRLVASYRELERKIADAERELNYLRSDPFQPPAAVFRSHITSIPIHTQGKDVFYWHQMCRTFQDQYSQVKCEIDDRNNQVSVLTNRIKELEATIDLVRK